MAGVLLYRLEVAAVVLTLLLAGSVHVDAVTNQELRAVDRLPVHPTTEEWAALIDETWGPGMTAEEDLALFDQWWNLVDSGYGAFQNLDIDLDAIRSRYRPEIAAGVSRGRLAAIMNQFALVLKDCHTFIADRSVTWGTRAEPGVPLMVVGPFPGNDRFGAALTLLPDDTLLVFRVLQNNPVGLVPGDIVLGYDGVLWSVLYRQLLEAELPIQLNWVWGSTDESMHHFMMGSAGLNWHLFDTIDIVKHATGETVHLPTALLNGFNETVLGNEQIRIPGVPLPRYFDDDWVSWGIVDGTDIGYVYVASWSSDPELRIREQFYHAINALMFQNHTSGLILDFRLNTGGGASEPEDGFALLFESDHYTIGYEVRVEGSEDHLEMLRHSFLTTEFLKIRGDPSSYYDRPIAVLIGPGSVSAGDVHTQRLLAHPMVRTFGKPSNGGFTLNDNPNLGFHWWSSRATGCAFTADEHRYLAHTGVQPDEEVWLTPEDVANGKDTVVEAAISWIQRPAPRNPSGRSAP